MQNTCFYVLTVSRRRLVWSPLAMSWGMMKCIGVGTRHSEARTIRHRHPTRLLRSTGGRCVRFRMLACVACHGIRAGMRRFRGEKTISGTQGVDVRECADRAGTHRARRSVREHVLSKRDSEGSIECGVLSRCEIASCGHWSACERTKTKRQPRGGSDDADKMDRGRHSPGWESAY